MKRGLCVTQCLVVALAAVFLAGCGTVRETYPGRTATEQLLISTAADRAIDNLALAEVNGKKIFLDVSKLESNQGNDKHYVIERLSKAVLDNGGALVAKAEDSQVVLEVASGALSIDRRDFAFGIPSVPIPIPQVGTASTPEVNLFKIVFNHGKAKFLINAVDPTTRVKLWEVPIVYGKSRCNFWWLLLTGPYKWNDMPF